MFKQIFLETNSYISSVKVSIFTEGVPILVSSFLFPRIVEMIDRFCHQVQLRMIALYFGRHVSETIDLTSFIFCQLFIRSAKLVFLVSSLYLEID